MKGMPQNPKESGVNRVVGFGEERNAELEGYFKHRFETESLRYPGKEKTVEQEKLINRMNSEMAVFLKQYGVEGIYIPLRDIKILDKSKFTLQEFEDLVKQLGTTHGFYSAFQQEVLTLRDFEEGKLSFFQNLAHELMHMQAFYSYQESDKESYDVPLKKDGEPVFLNIRRSGFSIGTKDGQKLLFHYINESIITELEMRFEKDFLEKWPELKDDLRIRDQLVKDYALRENVSIEEAQEVVAGFRRDFHTKTYVSQSHGYFEQRIKFNTLLDDIYLANKSDFKSKEEVFDLFARATLTGKLLPVAQLIQKTYGKDAFRWIGEKSASKRDE